MPTFAGVTPKTAVGSAKRRSQAAAISTPPPMQWPRIIATVGFGKSLRAACAARLSRRTSAIGSSGSAPPSRSEMSAPAQKLGPEPVTTRARTSGSPASGPRTSGSAAHMPAVIALRFSARSMVRTATWLWRDTTSPAPVQGPDAGLRVLGGTGVLFSAEVVRAERVADARVARLVAGHEPLLPLLRGPVGEGVLVHGAAAQVLLDEVVTDAGGGVERPVDVVLGDLGDQWCPGLVGHGLGVVGPRPGVAVGLQLQAHGAAGRAGLARRHLPVGAEQVLHVVAVLVRDDVGVDEQAALRAELALQLVEEGEVDVHELVGGAVERPRAAGRPTAAGLHRAGEEHGVGGHVVLAERGRPVVLDRVDVGHDRAVDRGVGVAAVVAGLLELAVVGLLALPEAGQPAQRGAGPAVAAAGQLQDDDDDQADEAEPAAPDRDAAAAAEPAPAPAAVLDARRVEATALAIPHPPTTPSRELTC